VLKKLIVDRLLKLLDKTEYGSFRLSLPDGRIYNFAGSQVGPAADLKLNDWRMAMSTFTKGDVGLAQAYRDGWWDSEDVYAMLVFAIQNQDALNAFIVGNPVAAFGSRIFYAFQKNTIKGSRKNIQAHYDLGNDFYKLWLDPTMTYSSALYKTKGEDLEQAQLNKYDRIVDRLDGGSGSILEIGCGWGGFGERAAALGDYGIRGITLSDEQHAYAQQRLGNKADIVLEDYRIQDSKVDHIVSIEMFEAVGEEYWSTYFGKIKELLNDKGCAVIQTITMADSFFDQYRKGTDFIRSYIFPGGMLPSPSIFKNEAEKAGLQLTGSFSFGHDYATTLLEWLKVFDERKADVLAQGYDEGFIRMWRLYLAGCAAGFSTERTDVMQIELRHG
jgi:cyclopropane-fatty-acyl-phospholipid synthase